MRPTRNAEPGPVRAVHLGLGGFHRAHQAWYTAADPEWGIAAHTFRGTGLPTALNARLDADLASDDEPIAAIDAEIPSTAGDEP